MSKVTINIDNAIALHNKANPGKELSREDIVNKLEGDITISTLQNWKGGKVPKAFFKIVEILFITGCKLEDILTMEKNGKTIK